jgi:hypothetical protein
MANPFRFRFMAAPATTGNGMTITTGTLPFGPV